MSENETDFGAGDGGERERERRRRGGGEGNVIVKQTKLLMLVFSPNLASGDWELNIIWFK